MNEVITLQIEDSNDQLQTVSCKRFAILLQDKEIWIQIIEGQLFIGTDVAEDDPELTNLILRPLATNLISIQLETDISDVNTRFSQEDEEEHCNHSNCQCGKP